MVYFLDLSVEDAMKRGQFGEERYEKAEMQRVVRTKFHEMKDSTWKEINALDSMDTIHNEL